MSVAKHSVLAALPTLALAACVTAPTAPEVPPRLEIHAANPIVVPGEAIGTLSSTDGCVRLTLANGHVLALQFPQGTTYSAQARAILLPNGQALPFGQWLDLVVNGGANLTSALPECQGIAATQVVSRDG